MSGRDISHLSSFNRHLALTDEQMLSLDQTARLLNVSVRTLQRMARRGEGPAPVRWGRKCTRYQLGMIRSWLANENRRALGGKKMPDEDDL
jgi:hypothetical protein